MQDEESLVTLYQVDLNHTANYIVKKCRSCDDSIYPNTPHRKWPENGYSCVSCVGFILSRYSYSFYVPEPTYGELAAKEKWDAEWENRVYHPYAATRKMPKLLNRHNKVIHTVIHRKNTRESP